MAILSRKRSRGGGDDGGNYGTQSNVAELTVAEYATAMPNIRIGDVIRSFGRQLTWIIPLLFIGMIGAWFLTKDFKRKYLADGRVLVQLGSEYVYESVTGGNSQGLQLTPDHIVLNEVGLMKNQEVIEKVVGDMVSKFGEQRFAPIAFSKINKASNARDLNDAYVDLYKMVENNYVVQPKPKSSVVDLVFKHEDPEVAKITVNAFIDEYIRDRKRIFVEGTGDAISKRREATEQQLRNNERQIQRFLAANNISDFDSEQKGAQKRTEDLRAALNLLRGQMSETEAALATVEQQLRGTPEQIDLYVDDRAAQRVAQSELELKALLGKYLPTSNIVRQKQAEIQEYRQLQNSRSGQAIGGRRVGPNTVYQALLTRRNTLQSSADSYREKEFTLQRQLDSVDAKVKRLTSLSPTLANLEREKETTAERLKGYTNKEQEALINQSQSQAESENVQVINYALRPRKGRNMRMIMFALATIGWGFTLFMFALLKVFLDPKLYSVPSPDNRMRYTPNMDIPEPVAPPMPFEMPEVPEAVPAAATAAYMPQAYDPPAYDGSAQNFTAQPYNPAAYPSEGYYTQGNTAYDMHDPDNPYLNGSDAGSLQEQSLLQSDVPIIGTLPTSENS